MQRTAVAVIVPVMSLALPSVLGSCATTETPGPAPRATGSTTARDGPAVASPDTAPRPSLEVGGAAWVAVSVATLWRSPASPRQVDTPALAAPARIRRWLGAMSEVERRGLDGRADTQALLGDRVRVVELIPGWARVLVPDQPSPMDRRGYPGWVPTRQLTATPPVVTDRVATVLRRTTWVRDDTDGRRLYRISFGTRLPVLSEKPTLVRAVGPTGRVLRLAPAAATMHDSGDAALSPGRASVVRTATSFEGLPYLWAGASGFGLDCSGLTWLTYRVHGIEIPRDAAPQSRAGTSVTEPRPGDLLFFADASVVDHVGMAVGEDWMVHAPGTGDVVRMSPRPADGFAGARSFLS